MKPRRIFTSLFAFSLFALCLPVAAQSYPAKPVRFIIPWPPGGTTDTLSRLTTQWLNNAWGVQVVADNRAGAAGNIGAESCAKSTADGYTLCMINVAQSIAPSVYPKLGFDPVRDFSHISIVATVPSLLLVHPSLPVRTVKELIALAKTRPGALNYASAGSGTTSHLIMEMFKSSAGVDLVHVPYKGGAPSLIDQLSGIVEISFRNAVGTIPFIERKQLRVLAVTTKERFPPLSGVPTMEESGLRGFEASAWNGVSAPAGTPREIVQKIHSEIMRMLKSPGMTDKLLGLGAIAVGNTPNEYTAFVKSDTERWAKISETVKVSVD